MKGEKRRKIGERRKEKRGKGKVIKKGRRRNKTRRKKSSCGT